MPRWGSGALALAVLTSASAVAVAADGAAALTTDQIVEKNAQARGGLEAWRKVQTMVWHGRIEAANPVSPSIAFVEEFKRPNKSRFEVDAGGEKSVRVFDGAYGWNLRSSDNRATVVRRYGPEALRSAREAPGIDGVLIDHEAKGIKVELGGMDEVDGHRAYRLNVTLRSGSIRHVWVDAQTFLELKYDRESRGRGRRSAVIAVRYGDYRRVDGLLIPMRIESGPQGSSPTERMMVDGVTLNLTLSDARFGRPTDLRRHDVLPRLQQSED